VVKTLHPVGRLSNRIELAPESRVRFEHERTAQERSASSPNRLELSPQLSADDEVAAAVRDALAAPLEFPPFAKMIVPGDRLAIAIDETLPHAAGAARGAVDAAVASGVALDAMAVVTSDAELASVLRVSLDNSSGESVRVVIHDPDDENDLCPVGQTRAGDWLRINRTLFDADVVLPIGCVRLPGRGDIGSVFDCLFPRFSDAAMIARLRAPARRKSGDSKDDARQQVEEAGWMFSVPLVVQVVPGCDGAVAEVTAGEPRAVAAHCQQSYRRLWSYQVDRRASLVIATITGGQLEQRWHNVGRALAVAERVADVGAAVAICTDLNTPPSRLLAQLLASGDWERAARSAADNHSVDGWTAWQLARALERGPVYLLSQLEAETIEDLGLAPVADLEELRRLASRHASCIVIDDSQHAVATVAGES
jgi:hypothetical protein